MIFNKLLQVFGAICLGFLLVLGVIALTGVFLGFLGVLIP